MFQNGGMDTRRTMQIITVSMVVLFTVYKTYYTSEKKAKQVNVFETFKMVK